MNCNRFYSKSRVLLGFLLVLLSACVLLIGFGGISKAFAARVGSARALPNNHVALSTKSDVASNPGPANRLDERGNRPGGISFLPLHQRSTRAIRPAGSGNWFPLGPPGGDVFDASASTVDPNIGDCRLDTRLKNAQNRECGLYANYGRGNAQTLFFTCLG